MQVLGKIVAGGRFYSPCSSLTWPMRRQARARRRPGLSICFGMVRATSYWGESWTQLAPNGNLSLYSDVTLDNVFAMGRWSKAQGHALSSIRTATARPTSFIARGVTSK